MQLNSDCHYPDLTNRHCAKPSECAFHTHCWQGVTGKTIYLWGQLDIFKKHVSDYRSGGSNSLKAVLPIIVPK